VLLWALAPVTAFAVGIAAWPSAITPNIGIDTGTVAGFAGQEWWAVGDGTSGIYTAAPANSLTLLHKSAGNPYGPIEYRTDWHYLSLPPNIGDIAIHYPGDGYWYIKNPNGAQWVMPNEYRGSTLQLKMEETAADINSASPKEYALIHARTLQAGDDINYPITGGDVTGQKLWPLSYDECVTIGNTAVRLYGADWWLRSPIGTAMQPFAVLIHYAPGPTFAVETLGSAGFGGYVTVSVRPAFNLDLSKVLFTSAAAGGKAVTPGDLEAAAAPASTIKFTMQDTGVAPGFKASYGGISGSTATIKYSGAAAGANKAVSAVVVSGGALGSGGVVEYYGQLVTGASIGGAGSVTLTLPYPLADFENDTYKLYAFEEEIHNDNFTDFATPPILLSFTNSGGGNNGGGGGDWTDPIVPLPIQPPKTGDGAGAAWLLVLGGLALAFAFHKKRQGAK
jgi:hypothetical protein